MISLPYLSILWGANNSLNEWDLNKNLLSFIWEETGLTSFIWEETGLTSSWKKGWTWTRLWLCNVGLGDKYRVNKQYFSVTRDTALHMTWSSPLSGSRVLGTTKLVVPIALQSSRITMYAIWDWHLWHSSRVCRDGRTDKVQELQADISIHFFCTLAWLDWTVHTLGQTSIPIWIVWCVTSYMEKSGGHLLNFLLGKNFRTNS